jgi:VanZ family protein
MLPLRFPWVWLTGGWLLVIVVCIASVMPQAALDLIDRFDIPDKVLHASSYCMLMVWFSGMYARRYYWILAVILLTLGLALEIAQRQLGHRSFELMDMAANLSGIIIGTTAAVAWLGGWCQRIEYQLGLRAR